MIIFSKSQTAKAPIETWNQEKHLRSLLPEPGESSSALQVEEHQGKVDDVGGHTHYAEVLQDEEKDGSQIEGAGE